MRAGPRAPRAVVAVLFALLLSSLAGNAAATVIIYSSNDGGQLRRTDGRTTTTVAGGFTTPRDFDFGPDGNLYVSEEAGSRISRINPTTGRAVGSAFGTSLRHIGLAFGPDGLLYVTSATPDYQTGLVERFVPGTGAAAGGPLALPSSRARYTTPVTGRYYEGMEIGPDGRVYCAGWRAGTVDVYQGPNEPNPGALVRRLSGGGLAQPVDLAFGPDGALYASDYSNSRIFRYDGTTFRTFASGSYLANPVGMDFDAGGDLFVANNTRHNIVRLQGPAGPQPGALLGVFATTPSSPATLVIVPEPSGAALLLAAARVLPSRRSRSRRG